MASQNRATAAVVRPVRGHRTEGNVGGESLLQVQEDTRGDVSPHRERNKIVVRAETGGDRGSV
eukprot:2529270-Pyramimonas_sp.AAC.1